MIHHLKVKKSIQKMIKTLNFQIDEIDQLIREHIDADDDFKNKDRILQSDPGLVLVKFAPQKRRGLLQNIIRVSVVARSALI